MTSPAWSIANGADADTLAQGIALMGATMSHARDTEIFGENEPADYLYKVVKGTVRTCKTLNDRRRQIGGIYLRGDIFGLEFADEYTLSADAITDAKVLVVRRSAPAALAEREAAIGRELHASTRASCGGFRSASCCSSRARRNGSLVCCWQWLNAVTHLTLSNCRSRAKISHLGLTIETVSRTLSALESAAAIDVPTSRRS